MQRWMTPPAVAVIVLAVHRWAFLMLGTIAANAGDRALHCHVRPPSSVVTSLRASRDVWLCPPRPGAVSKDEAAVRFGFLVALLRNPHVALITSYARRPYSTARAIPVTAAPDFGRPRRSIKLKGGLLAVQP